MAFALNPDGRREKERDGNEGILMAGQEEGKKDVRSNSTERFAQPRRCVQI